MKYTIIHVNDRAKEQMDHNKKILKDFEYVNEIEFFNGNTGNAWDVINHRGIRTDTWKPYDGRSFEALPGEYGIWLGLLNIWEYMLTNEIDRMLVLEDDVRLTSLSVNMISGCILELPEGWDFLSLYYFQGQNTINEESDLGLEFIHKSINQPAAGQATIFSKSGAKKLLKLAKRKGIEYTSDCFIFEQSRIGILNGYSIIPDKLKILEHTYSKTGSLIDPKNVRSAGF